MRGLGLGLGLGIGRRNGAGLTVPNTGASTFILVLAATGTGTAEDGVISGTGASEFTLLLAATGSGAESMTGTGTSTFTLLLAADGSGAETMTGTGASEFTLLLAADGAGSTGAVTGTGASTFTLVLAATGAGEGSEVLDAGLSGLTLWYKGDAGITQSSNQVSAWADQSPSGYNTDHVSATKPTYAASGQNGLPTVQFIAASSTYLSREANSPCHTTACTYMCVVKVGAATTAWLMSHGVGNIGGIGLEQDAVPKWVVQRQGTSGAPGDGTPDSAFHVITFRAPNTSTYPDFRIDGVQQYAQAAGSWSIPDQSGVVPTWVAEIVLGAQDSTSAHTYGSFSDCTWAELAVLNREMNTPDLHAIEQQLGAKWNITIT